SAFPVTTGSLATFAGGGGGKGGISGTYSQGIPGGLGSTGTGVQFNANESGGPFRGAGSTTLIEFTEGAGGYVGIAGPAGNQGLNGFTQHGVGGVSSGGSAGGAALPQPGGSGGGGGGTGGGGQGGNGGRGGNGSTSGPGGAGVAGGSAIANTGGGGGGGGAGGTPLVPGSSGAGGAGGSGQLTVFWFQGSAGPPGPPVAFVWQPGGPSQQGNLYTSWSALMAAANAVQGISIVLVDNTFAAANVPAGTWNVDNVQFFGHATTRGSFPTLTFLDGAKLTFSTLYLTNILATSSSSSSVVTFDGIGGVLILTNAGLFTTSTAPFVHVAGTAGSNFNLITQGGE